MREPNKRDVGRAREYLESKGRETERLSGVRLMELAGMREPENIQFTTRECPGCHQARTLTVSKAGVADWYAGALIQVALPELTVDEREQVMTGYDQECWDKLFPAEEE